MGMASAAISGGLSIKSAREQMAFQLRMDSTKYQRGMADMRKAGLNPILAYQQGGAGGASGAGFSYPDSGGGPISGALTTAAAYQQYKNLRSEGGRIDAQTGETITRSASNVAGAELNSALAAKARSDAIAAGHGAKVKEAEAIRSELGKNVSETPYVGQGLEYLQRTIEALRGSTRINPPTSGRKQKGK